MLAIALNPGFVCILAALFVLGAPRPARAPIMAGAAIAALWLMLDRDFGAAAAAAQMGLPVVLFDLDALNRIFGIAMLIALIAIAICSGARRNRSEDAAILLMAGGAVSALFVGDLVSFVASVSLAGLASAWLVFSSPVVGAARSGVRLLMWQGIESQTRHRSILPPRLATHRSSPDALVNPAELFHFLGIEQIAPIEHDRGRKRLPRAFQIKLLEFVPFGGNHQGITVQSDLVHVLYIRDVWQQRTGLFHALGIVNA
jgi:hypothetical protein